MATSYLSKQFGSRDRYMPLPYYKRFPRDFLEGTVGLPFEAKGAYSIVLDLIYMHDGRLPDDGRYIAGQIGCSVRRWKAIRAELVAAGKIQANLGIISNFRADYLTEESRKYQDKQAQNAGRPRKFKGLAQPKPNQSESESESYNSPHYVRAVSAQQELLPSEAIPPSTTEASPSRKTRKKQAREETTWPDGFELDGDLHRYAEEAGIPFQEIPRVWERFKNHHQARGSRFKDWRAAWRTWALNEVKFSRERRGNGGRAAYDPIEFARRQIAEFARQEEDEGTLWPKTAN